VSPELAYGMDLGMWGLPSALGALVAGLGVVTVVTHGLEGLRWRLMRRPAGALAAGPWQPTTGGVHILLAGGPARFLTGSRLLVVENGGMLVLDGARSPTAGLGRAVRVAAGASLRVSAAEIGEPDGPAGAETVWLCTRRVAAGGGEPGARSPDRGSQPRR